MRLRKVALERSGLPNLNMKKLDEYVRITIAVESMLMESDERVQITNKNTRAEKQNPG